ncbi:MAG TPA: polyphosphate polymerase domain-containing protein [Sedimentisphaerales bacterium]|nr:polyphosphate polymerase domain-containing protein [Sedimentisphaerales bacterium]
MLASLSESISRKRRNLYKWLHQPGLKAKDRIHHQDTVTTVKDRPDFTDSLPACRYELKYLITESQAAAIEHFVGPYLHLDHYCKTQPLGSYPILSLYLDSPQLHLCRQTLEGRTNRFKLRIRSYTDDPDYPRFFEIKRRLNAVIIKSRARVIHPDVPRVVSGLSLPSAAYHQDDLVLRQFQFYMKSINARPVVRIRYLRRAYEADTENRVRVTFDRELAYAAGTTTDLSLNGSRWRRNHLDRVILEIKFTGRYPAWLNDMARCFGLRQQSFSKYVSSVQQTCSLNRMPGGTIP